MPSCINVATRTYICAKYVALPTQTAAYVRTNHVRGTVACGLSSTTSYIYIYIYIYTIGGVRRHPCLRPVVQ